MKIAVPTNDRINLAQRTGRAKEFALIDIQDGELKNIKYVENHHEHHEHEEEHEHSHGEIVEILKDVELFLVLNVGKHLKQDLERGEIKYEKIKLETITEVINYYKAM